MARNVRTWFLCISAAIMPCLSAELVFEKTRLELTAGPDQEKVEAVFKFENRGTTEARIIAVSSGCDCLTAKPTVDVIPPKGSSEIAGVFKIPNLPGVNERAIHVHVSEGGKERSLLLTVAVERKPLITVKPPLLIWPRNQPGAERAFTVTMNGQEPIRLLDFESSRPGFDVRMETIKEGVEYRVHVTPQTTANASFSVLRLKTDCKHPQYATPTVFAQVKNL
jgi:hypothetical protein